MHRIATPGLCVTSLDPSRILILATGCACLIPSNLNHDSDFWFQYLGHHPLCCSGDFSSYIQATLASKHAVALGEPVPRNSRHVRLSTTTNHRNVAVEKGPNTGTGTGNYCAWIGEILTSLFAEIPGVWCRCQKKTRSRQCTPPRPFGCFLI